MSGFWGRRKRQREAQAQADAELAQRAGRALVEADERIRVTTDELEFAHAELGEASTKDLRRALEAVRTHLAEAFQLNQLNVDEIPDTTEERRTRNARIIQLCEWAEGLLDDKTQELAEKVALVRRAPEIIAGVRRDAERLRERLPNARAVIDRLAERYADSAVAKVERSADEAEQLLRFAEHSASVSERRRDLGNSEEANLALETATEGVRRAAVLLDGVEDFEIEALRAESTLQAVIDDSRNDLVAARTAPRSEAVTEAAAALDTALRALPAPGTKADPFTELSRLRTANDALDRAVEKARARAARPLPTREQVEHSLDDADRQISVARGVIAGHRGWIGADARTRFAEAERVRADVERLGFDEDSIEAKFHGSRRAATLASEALQFAQRDIEGSRPQNDDWGWGGGGNRGGGGGGMGTLLGGVILGGILGDMFD